MGKTGYARVLQALAVTSRRPPTRLQYTSRVVTLATFVVKSVYPEKYFLPSKRFFRGNFDPEGKDDGLDTDNPRLDSLDRYVRELKVSRQFSLLLRVAVLETQIYTTAKKAYEVTLDKKFVGTTKFHYREWAGFTKTPESTMSPGKVDMQAGSWVQHDRQPDLLVILPELHSSPLPVDQGRPYPPLLREWWSKGYVTAQTIDSMGIRTRCQFWQLARHFGSHQHDERFMETRKLALQAERLKAEICSLELERDISLLEKEVASVTSKLVTTDGT